MKDEKKGPLHGFVKAVLFALSLVYRLAVGVVDLAYRSGLRRRHRAGVPVISVGNITLGGTGKTPLTIFLADHLVSSGRKPAVLTRGYGNDESKMLRDVLAEVPVFVGQDRVRSARWAAAQERDVLILDDGYQHRRLARDLNLLLLDSASPFGNGHLVPRGTLREPASSVKRADMVILTKVDRTSPERISAAKERIGELAPGMPIISTRHRPACLLDVTGAAYSPGSISGQKIMLISGIVDPDYLAYLLERLGGRIAGRLDYPDHYRYTWRDVEKIRRQCDICGAEKIITTKKDYVKIRMLDISQIEEKLFVLDIAVDVVEGKEELFAGLDSSVPGKGA
ncbi:MAG: tetraacyldisaccharide 4'-kinase [Candidatus Omnitrophica bacterium]|nr:tetraacyldisaccharide 4'-kinase [Candidatus Omnitrophota bacterium]